jgi:hypothetical protein
VTRPRLFKNVDEACAKTGPYLTRTSQHRQHGHFSQRCRRQGNIQCCIRGFCEDVCVKLQKFLRNPIVLVAIPVVVLGAIFDQPVLIGLAMSLIACLLIRT